MASISNHCSADCALAEKSCNTQVRIHEASYVWTIHNFDFFEAKGTTVNSPFFAADSNNDIRWIMQLEPNGDTDAKDTVSLYLMYSSRVHEKVYAKYNFYVLNSQQNKQIHRTSEEVREFSDGISRGYQNILNKKEAIGKSLLIDNKLTVMCEVYFSEVRDSIDKTFHQCDKTSLYRNVPRCNVFENLEQLLEDGQFSDIVLVAGGKEYPAHRNILASRCSAFAAILERNSEENGRNRFNIKDMSAEIMDEFLRYIYTGKCNNLQKVAEDLLAVASKYSLDRLKMICAEEVYKTLSVENAAKILMLADTHGLKELKNEVIKFITRKPAEVLNTVAWANIKSNFWLVNDVCLALANR
ncbi:speckle-type POZ protein B-like [Planococcus citri]|uniref:speckle-type POZ protein B-like n=1 Tax=Planococcus citri TaxID=170843 RepID=UPI0031F83996